jgi:ABC-type phosphate transport system substrate-binding protein
MTKYSENQGITASKFKSCHWCGYNANLSTAVSCEVCGRALNKKGMTIFNSRPPSLNRKPLRWLGLGCLALLIGGIGLVWKPWSNKISPVSSPSSAVGQSPSNPGSRLYSTDSMREVQNVPSGLFSYGVSLPFVVMASNGMNTAIADAHPTFRLRYTEPIHGNPGSGTAISMTVNGDVSFGQSARPLEDQEHAKAKDRNITLEQIPVGIDGVIFYTHQDLLIPGLSVEQLQNIFRGKITNWKQVGGPNLPITPFSLEPASTSSLKLLLGTSGSDIGKNVKIVRDYTAGIRKVAETPGAISYGSASAVVGQQTIQTIGLSRSGSSEYIFPLQENGQINTVAFQDGKYPLTRRLFVIIRHDGTPDEQAGIAYANLLLSREGQKIIQKSGFVPIH